MCVGVDEEVNAIPHAGDAMVCEEEDRARANAASFESWPIDLGAVGGLEAEDGGIREEDPVVRRG